MLKKENTYFEELNRIAAEFEKKQAEHEARKQATIDTYGWDSEEVKAWYEEKAKMEYPIPAGTCKAYRAWQGSIRKQLDEVEMEDSLWDRERADFVEALRKAGIDTFVATTQSTGLMEDLHGYAAQGCTMEGLCTITRREKRWGEEETCEVQGIRFRVN